MSMMYDFNQPGVSSTRQLINISRQPHETAMPVFIGYVRNHEAKHQHVFRIQSLHDFQTKFGGGIDGGYLFSSLSLYFNNGGGECYVISLGVKENVASDPVSGYAGVFDLILDEPEITLLVLPEMVNLKPEEWLKLVTLVGRACMEADNLFAIIDYPSDPDIARACNESGSWIGEERMAGYWPWIYHRTDSRQVQLDANPDNFSLTPPSGAIAAAMQQNDRQRGLWRAPANIPIEKAIRPEFNHLHPVTLFHATPGTGRSVNQIRSFPGRGVRVWGCRTLTTSSDVRKLYIQNVRLVRWLTQTLKGALRPFVYEQNNEITWYRIHTLIRRHLKVLWEQGGLIGEMEEDAYLIEVGGEVGMSEAEMLNGLLRVRVGIATHRPAEFIRINLDFYINSSSPPSEENHPSGELYEKSL
ncbi:phage tail sheath family protein [Enterobacter sp. ECC-175]|uniref:phage tail sheath family protein n=1 Tax=unclassified Enterobacter TaxID=2608935 RepID=UPI000D4C675C|nr:phage tail sheath family protein [Enterobacter sp. RIT 418]RAU29887.1 hypothetical protein DBY73_021575 [Enterobacter sp. RIT 418]